MFPNSWNIRCSQKSQKCQSIRYNRYSQTSPFRQPRPLHLKYQSSPKYQSTQICQSTPMFQSSQYTRLPLKHQNIPCSPRFLFQNIHYSPMSRLCLKHLMCQSSQYTRWFLMCQSSPCSLMFQKSLRIQKSLNN